MEKMTNFILQKPTILFQLGQHAPFIDIGVLDIIPLYETMCLEFQQGQFWEHLLGM